MSVICPRCQTQCGDDDTYCFRCGNPLPAASGRSAAADGDASEHVPATSPAATWPTPETSPEESTGTYVPPSRSTSEAAGEDEPDFVPLQFESSKRGPEGPRRWLLLAAVLMALLVAGIAAAMIWQNAGDDGDDDVAQVALGRTPTAVDAGAVVATPATTTATPATASEAVSTPAADSLASPPASAPPAPSTPDAVTGFAAATSTSTPAIATPPESTATLAPTATATLAPTATVAPTATATAEPSAVPSGTNRRAALADMALLPSGVLRTLAGEGATPPATPAGSAATPPPRGDGTGGVILLPAESTSLPGGDAPQPTPTPGTD